MRKVLTRVIVALLAIYLIFFGSTVILKNVFFPRSIAALLTFVFVKNDTDMIWIPI